MPALVEQSDGQIATCRELLLSEVRVGKEQKSSQKAALKKCLAL
jgi:hypothetical protein